MKILANLNCIGLALILLFLPKTKAMDNCSENKYLMKETSNMEVDSTMEYTKCDLSYGELFKIVDTKNLRRQLEKIFDNKSYSNTDQDLLSLKESYLEIKESHLKSIRKSISEKYPECTQSEIEKKANVAFWNILDVLELFEDVLENILRLEVTLK